MAVIKTLLLQDSVRLVGRLRIWTLLFALCCINYAWGTAPDKPAITVTGTPAVVAISATKYSQTATKSVKLTCAATCSGCTPHFEFTQDGIVVQNYSTEAAYDIANMDASHAGQFKCNARDSAKTTDKSESDAYTLTLTCTTEGKDNGCGLSGECHKDQSYYYCRCRLNNAGVFRSGCHECSATDKDDCGSHATCESNKCKCTYGGHAPKCQACTGTDTGCGKHATCGGTAPKKCVCTYGGADPACHACNGTHNGCEADSNAPRCDGGTPPKCDKCMDDKFCEKLDKNKPVCDKSKGNCKAKGKTSDAATVTSTVSVFIASVIVALLN